MRLLFVCPDMGIGGAERHWATLIPALADRGVDVKLLALAGRGPFFDEVAARGVPAECLDLRRRTDPGGLRRALAVSADFGPDAVVTRGVSGQLVGEAIARRARPARPRPRTRPAGLRAHARPAGPRAHARPAGPPRRARAAHVYNEHTPLTPSGRLVPPRPHQRALTRLVARAIDDVIAVTDRQVPPLEALGYPRGRIEVVPNGVFAREVEGVRPSDELPRDGFTVLCVSGLRPEKRVDLFIESVGAARLKDPAIRGYVAGDGRERERLAPLAAAHQITLLGERRDVLELVAAAGAVCLPSEAEAMPFSILEAMALARPVVATDVGGTRDQVLPGETGYLVAPGDGGAIERALLELAADRSRAEAMGVAGRRLQRERFSGERMVDGYQSAFERVVGRGQA